MPRTVRVNIAHILQMMRDDDEVPRGYISQVMKNGFPKEILKIISEHAIQGRNADLLKTSNDFWNTSANLWRLHDGRVWIHTTREITRKFCPILDEDNPKNSGYLKCKIL